jgi:hypothetical protein
MCDISHTNTPGLVRRFIAGDQSRPLDRARAGALITTCSWQSFIALLRAHLGIDRQLRTSAATCNRAALTLVIGAWRAPLETLGRAPVELAN